MIRALVVDDSSFMRKSLTYLLESDPRLAVVGTAADGVEAVRLVKELHPSVVLLDVGMPRMDGLEALTHIMAERPTPVVMLSGLGRTDASLAIRSLERGAVDFIAKPSGTISYDIEAIREDLILKVKLAAEVDVRKLVRFPYGSLPPCGGGLGWGGKRPESPTPWPSPIEGEGKFAERPSPEARERIVVIGASTGGPRAVSVVLSELPPVASTVFLVVLHLAPEFVGSLADHLRAECNLPVAVAREDEVLDPGRIVFAPGDCHVRIAQADAARRLRFGERVRNLPSIDQAMESAALAYGSGAVGVLLTGMGNDGAQGMKAIKKAGGGTIAEDVSTCVVFGMPKAAIDLGCVDRVVPLPWIAQAILEFV